MMLMLAVLALSTAEPPSGVPADDPSADVAGLQQMYDQSCAAREYGAYDDLCGQLADQLKQARVEADRAARRKASDAKRHPGVAPPTSPQPAAGAGPDAPVTPASPSQGRGGEPPGQPAVHRVAEATAVAST